MDHTNWTLEWLKIAQGLFGTLVGGGLVLLGSWLADHRKDSTENRLRHKREAALLTGMFAVRNFIAERINEWLADGRHSRLEPLQTAQAYIHRLIEKAPGESESLIIVVIEIGLTVDALLATMEKIEKQKTPAAKNDFSPTITQQANAVMSSLEQFDTIAQSHLMFLNEDELSRFSGYENRPDAA